jgi:signal transduction histidine kinase
VTVDVSHPGDQLRLEVSDDGSGFRPAGRDDQVATGHVGLHLLGALAGDAGGRLDVRSDGRSGTCVVLELPTR